MKNLQNYKWLQIAIIFTLLSTLSLYAGEEKSSLAYINTLRQKSGLIKFKANSKLNRAAKSHASYLVRQQRNGHYEKRGWKGYTGRTPSDRVLKAGYSSKEVMENVTVNAKNAHHSVDILFAAIYHRFVFLNFENDEIGIGSSSTNKKRRVTSAFVYNTGLTEINKLCKKSYIMENNTYYVQNMCKKSDRLIPKELYEQKKNKVRGENRALVLYPYPDAKNVVPVFYTENPHPLPGSKVSGFPVSMQFNPLFYKNVKLKKFRLFDERGKRVKNVKILTSKSDINHRFTKLQFALMPLKRLEYAKRYQVKFEAIADGKKIIKSWYFTTKKLKGTVHKITQRKTTLKAKRGEKIVLYFEPKSNRDILNKVTYSKKLHITREDHNTLLFTIPKNRYFSQKYSIKAGKKSVIIVVE